MGKKSATVDSEETTKDVYKKILLNMSVNPKDTVKLPDDYGTPFILESSVYDEKKSVDTITDSEGTVEISDKKITDKKLVKGWFKYQEIQPIEPIETIPVKAIKK